ncbi:hypothetical protein CEXT_216441 [Caerostris extrusa]|uniref:Uncharacterized protein n=1 Tax=Caerostris extrusa TaxID=172846 RepID=A0AAV4M6K5_CAEEX|nr:hypothetical protein CEXT_216441 [Caerostris extrusa]
MNDLKNFSGKRWYERFRMYSVLALSRCSFSVGGFDSLTLEVGHLLPFLWKREAQDEFGRGRKKEARGRGIRINSLARVPQHGLRVLSPTVSMETPQDNFFFFSFIILRMSDDTLWTSFRVWEGRTHYYRMEKEYPSCFASWEGRGFSAVGGPTPQEASPMSYWMLQILDLPSVRGCMGKYFTGEGCVL